MMEEESTFESGRLNPNDAELLIRARPILLTCLDADDSILDGLVQEKIAFYTDWDKMKNLTRREKNRYMLDVILPRARDLDVFKEELKHGYSFLLRDLLCIEKGMTKIPPPSYEVTLEDDNKVFESAIVSAAKTFPNHPLAKRIKDIIQNVCTCTCPCACGCPCAYHSDETRHPPPVYEEVPESPSQTDIMETEDEGEQNGSYTDSEVHDEDQDGSVE